jgi:hypothetical protein
MIGRARLHRLGSLLGLVSAVVLWSWVAPLASCPRSSAAAWEAAPLGAPGQERAPVSPSSEPESDDDDRGDDLIGQGVTSAELAPAEGAHVAHPARRLALRAGHSLLPERPPRA